MDDEQPKRDNDSYGKFIRKKMQKLIDESYRPAEHISRVTYRPGQEDADIKRWKEQMPQNGD